MIENGKEVEVLDEEIETLPDAGGIVPTGTKEQIQDIVEFAENVDRYIQAQNRIRMSILKLTQPSDWTLFGSADKKTAEIGFAPANRIGSTMGVSYINWSSEKITGMDEKGSWYRWEYQADAVWRNRTIRVYGRAGSRDKFFGKKDGEYKELHDVDEGNIKMAAMRACKKEGVKDLFGFHHLDPEYLKQHGINLSAAGGHAFKGKEEKAEATEALTIAISEVKLDKSGKTVEGKIWNLYSVKTGEGDVFKTFSTEFFEVAKKAKDANVLASICFEKTEKGNKITAISLTEQKAF